MTLEDLKDRYGRSSNHRQLFNRAIRAECPGGAEVLDALELLDNVRRRTLLAVGKHECAEIAALAVDRLHSARNAMVASIQDKYRLGVT